MKVGAVVSSNSLYWTDLFNNLKINKSSSESLDLPQEGSREFICSCGQPENENSIHFDRATNEYIVQGNCDLNKPCCAIAVDKHRLQRQGLARIQLPQSPLSQHHTNTIPNQTINENQKRRASTAISKLEEFLLQKALP